MHGKRLLKCLEKDESFCARKMKEMYRRRRRATAGFFKYLIANEFLIIVHIQNARLI